MYTNAFIMVLLKQALVQVWSMNLEEAVRVVGHGQLEERWQNNIHFYLKGTFDEWVEMELHEYTLDYSE